ncbi:glycosyltransferase family 2 protein [Longispora albida]|uniref:glycosyltransferase family 2 protein n=1 Tax=Longispora albida TaxID=203523 RepID=UPI000377CEFB|nr:glycosyltransferase family 2 protein [Longispora albida]
MNPVLSVVIPMYNEELVLPLLAQRLRPVLDGLGEPYEVVAVDDGSADATPAVLAGLRRSWPELRVIRLRRNCGHQAALAAGIRSAFGDYLVSIDADLQDPPEVIPEMLAKARAGGLDVVYGIRSDRTTDTAFKRGTAGLYYRLMRRLVGRQMPDQAGDFRLLSRAAVDALSELPEQAPVYRLVVPWLGLPSGEVSYARERRAAGETKYPLSKMVKLTVDSVTSFSAAPLRLATWLGLSVVALCVALAAAAVIAFATGSVVPGWASTYLVVLFIGAIQLVCLGVLGEYVAQIYRTLQARPAYFIGYDSAAPDSGSSTGRRQIPAPRSTSHEQVPRS